MGTKECVTRSVPGAFGDVRALAGVRFAVSLSNRVPDWLVQYRGWPGIGTLDSATAEPELDQRGVLPIERGGERGFFGSDADRGDLSGV